MAYFLFVDESGLDARSSPYEVLGGIAIKDEDIWNLIKAIHNLEFRYFDMRYSTGNRELKARKLLKRKTFRLASQIGPIPHVERRVLARRCLENGSTAGHAELAALSQAKLEFVRDLLQTALAFRCKAFASVFVNRGGNEELIDFLRKDYVYFFERFFYFLEGHDDSMGAIVFDEREKSESHILLSQIEAYFKRTENGRERSLLIIPEPLFVHSDLTSGIQIADIIAYCISWSYRLRGMDKPIREELRPYLDIIKRMRFRTTREFEEGEKRIWSVVVV